MKNEWFKIKKFRNYERNICGVYNKFFRILKEPKGNYCYQFSDFLSMEYRVLHNGVKIKYLNRYFIYVFTFLFNILGLPLLFFSYYPLRYLNGAKNFIKDTAWYQDVRFFSWINFIY